MPSSRGKKGVVSLINFICELAIGKQSTKIRARAFISTYGTRQVHVYFFAGIIKKIVTKLPVFRFAIMKLTNYSLVIKSNSSGCRNFCIMFCMSGTETKIRNKINILGTLSETEFNVIGVQFKKLLGIPLPPFEEICPV